MVAGMVCIRVALVAAGVTAVVTPAVTVGVEAAGAATSRVYVTTAVGAPTKSTLTASDAGAVDVYLSDGTRRQLDEQTLGLAPVGSTQPARFGASVAVTDLDQDGYSDLVIGAPVAALGDAAGVAPGHVDIVFGNASGPDPSRVLKLASPGAAGDRFGHAVAVTGSSVAGHPLDLWIGAPGTKVGAATDAGAVYRYSVGGTGVPTRIDTMTQERLGVGGNAEAGDLFGEVLAPTVDGVVVGEPHEDVGSVTDAGAVQTLLLDSGGTFLGSQDWSQNTPGVPGAAEAGDHFGAAVGPFGYTVGVPGEDVGKLTDAGLVQEFIAVPGDQSLRTVRKAVTQDSPGIPGAAEAHDGFGTSLAAVTRCAGVASTAIGAPGEDLGGSSDAGSVTFTPAPYELASACPATVVGESAHPSAGDRFGSALTAISRDPLASAPTGSGAVVVGVPGYNTGIMAALTDVGRIQLGGSWFGLLSGDLGLTGYGSVLATPMLT